MSRPARRPLVTACLIAAGIAVAVLSALAAIIITAGSLR
jgi:hypothetical protein